MTADKIQAQVDADEAEVTARYEGRRRIADAIDAAARRADAMSRLEAWLRVHPAHSATPPKAA